MSRYVYSFDGKDKEKRYRGEVVATGAFDAIGRLPGSIIVGDVVRIREIGNTELPLGIIKMEEVDEPVKPDESDAEDKLLEEKNAEVDRLARFRSNVCRLLAIGGEQSDEAILDALKESVHGSWKSAKPNSGNTNDWVTVKIDGNTYFRCTACGRSIRATFDNFIDYVQR